MRVTEQRGIETLKTYSVTKKKHMTKFEAVPDTAPQNGPHERCIQVIHGGKPRFIAQFWRAWDPETQSWGEWVKK